MLDIFDIGTGVFALAEFTSEDDTSHATDTSHAIDTSIPQFNSPDIEEYVVKQGDWLAKIAKSFFGEKDAYKNALKIAKVNKIPNPDHIVPGQKLLIPVCKNV